jgi:hypothetical protein
MLPIQDEVPVSTGIEFREVLYPTLAVTWEHGLMPCESSQSSSSVICVCCLPENRLQNEHAHWFSVLETASRRPKSRCIARAYIITFNWACRNNSTINNSVATNNCPQIQKQKDEHRSVLLFAQIITGTKKHAHDSVLPLALNTNSECVLYFSVIVFRNSEETISGYKTRAGK